MRVSQSSLPPGRPGRLLVEVGVAELPLERPRRGQRVLLRARLPDLPEAALGPRRRLRRQDVLHLFYTKINLISIMFSTPKKMSAVQ